MSRGWDQIAKALIHDRETRQMTQTAYARTIGISRRTLSDLEAGGRGQYRATTLAAVDVALRWLPGSADDVAAGRKPKPDRDELWSRLDASWAKLTDAERAALVAAAERLAEDR